MVQSTEETQLVTFIIDSENYGIDLGLVKEIVKIPPITYVPNTPDYFEGVINLRGEILSVIDMRSRFNLDGIESNEFSRIIITHIEGTKIGIVVDEVSEVFQLNNLKIQPPPPITKGIDDKFVKGMIEIKEQNHIILLLDMDEIINKDDFNYDRGTDYKNTDFSNDVGTSKKKVEETQMVTCRIGKENYGIEIHDVEEILDMPEITTVPQVPDFITGIISLRNSIIPLINLGIRFNIKLAGVDGNKAVIIVTVFGFRVGLIVDEISEVLKVPKEDIVPPPPHLTEEEAGQLQGVVKEKIKNQVKLILLMDLKKIFTEELQDILGEITKKESNQDDESDIKKAENSEKQVTIVSFNTAEDIFCVPIDAVKEIIVVPEITLVPKSPSFVKGIINLRGEIITVIDLRKRFDFELRPPDDFSRIIIVSLEENITGFLVDMVRAVRSVAVEMVEPAPNIIKGINTEFIEGVIQLKDEKKMLIMLNIKKILSEDEKEELAENVKEKVKVKKKVIHKKKGTKKASKKRITLKRAKPKS